MRLALLRQALGPAQASPGRFVHLRDGFADFGAITLPPCPPDFSASLCTQRNDLVTKLAGFSIVGVSPISATDAAGYVDPLLRSINQSAQDGASPYVIKALVVGGVATLAGIVLTIAAVRKCRKSCGTGR